MISQGPVSKTCLASVMPASKMLASGITNLFIGGSIFCAIITVLASPGTKSTRRSHKPYVHTWTGVHRHMNTRHSIMCVLSNKGNGTRFWRKHAFAESCVTFCSVVGTQRIGCSHSKFACLAQSAVLQCLRISPFTDLLPLLHMMLTSSLILDMASVRIGGQ